MKLKNLLLSFLVISLLSCSEDYKQKKNLTTSGYKNLNVTILIDLSDRISRIKNPEQAEKDMNIISFVLDSYKLFLDKKGVVNSEDKIKVIFYPTINYDLYQSIADSLNIDFANYDYPIRKNIYKKISSLYNTNLRRLYALASNSKKYEGSDLFNYFKHRVVDDCILNDSNYINILVILTDGYIYHKNSMYESGYRYSYLLPDANHIKNLRQLNNWQEIFSQKNYGLIKIDNDLHNLNILVAEINPVVFSPKDFDIIKLYWSKWFEEQNVKKDNYKILKTDLTSINKNLVYNFFNKITGR